MVDALFNKISNMIFGPNDIIALDQVVEEDTHFARVTDIFFDTVGSDSYLVRGHLEDRADNLGIQKDI